MDVVTWWVESYEANVWGDAADKYCGGRGRDWRWIAAYMCRCLGVNAVWLHETCDCCVVRWIKSWIESIRWPEDKIVGPRDRFYFSWFAQDETGFTTRFCHQPDAGKKVGCSCFNLE